MELPVRDPGWATISGQERSRRMQEAAVGLLLFLGRMKPVVLLVEDLQWIDAESEAVLVRLAQAVPTVRFLLILTCRPEYDRSAFAAAGPAEIRLPAFNAAEAARASRPSGWPRSAARTAARRRLGRLQGQCAVPGRDRPSARRDGQAGRAAGPLPAFGRGRRDRRFGKHPVDRRCPLRTSRQGCQAGGRGRLDLRWRDSGRSCCEEWQRCRACASMPPSRA